MRLFGGLIFVAALAAANMPAANASPLEAGRPAGVRQAQGMTTSMLAFSTGVVVCAGASLVFSRVFGGSVETTTPLFTGGGIIIYPTFITTTTTTATTTTTTGTP